MSLMERFQSRGVHRDASSAEERAALRESIDVLANHAVRARLTPAVAAVDEAIAAIRTGRSDTTAVLDALLDVRSTLTGGA
jgi:hypothetical protein